MQGRVAGAGTRQVFLAWLPVLLEAAGGRGTQRRGTASRRPRISLLFGVSLERAETLCSVPL